MTVRSFGPRPALNLFPGRPWGAQTSVPNSICEPPLAGTSSRCGSTPLAAAVNKPGCIVVDTTSETALDAKANAPKDHNG